MPDFKVEGKFEVPLYREAVAKDWAQRGYDCRVFTDPPGQRWENFVHNYNELVTVVEGYLELEIEGTVMETAPGDEAVIPTKAVHSVRNTHN